MGGLTVLREVISRLPYENVVYLGDTARVPYGIRSQSTVIRYSDQNADFLVGEGIKALVVACNTVSAVGIEQLENKLSIPVIGVLEPGALKATKTTRTGRIGVIGTEATINSGAYQRALKDMYPDVFVVAKACPLFVPLVEEGWTEGTITKDVIRKYLKSFKRYHIDTLVLGCTHYPLLKRSISEYMGEETVLVDSAVETAKEAKRILMAEGILKSDTNKGKRCFYVTDSPDRFKEVGEMFLAKGINDIRLVDIR
jgi:glutamate racemase